MKTMKLTMKDLLANVNFHDSKMSEIAAQNPKQFLSTEIYIPVWQIDYKYTTVRGNTKVGVKYLFHREDYWDSVENEFMLQIDNFNMEHKDRQLLNVKILSAEYLGDFILDIEK